MSNANVSPTISKLTLKKSNWFSLNGGGIGNGNNPKSIYDNDGFDVFGYSSEGLDRAGVSLAQYKDPTSKGRDGVKLYDSVSAYWASTDILTMRKSVDKIANSPDMMKKVEEIQSLQKILPDGRASTRIETLKKELELFLESN